MHFQFNIQWRQARCSTHWAIRGTGLFLRFFSWMNWFCLAGMIKPFLRDSSWHWAAGVYQRMISFFFLILIFESCKSSVSKESALFRLPMGLSLFVEVLGPAQTSHGRTLIFRSCSAEAKEKSSPTYHTI